MKILITGHNGFIGKNVVANFSEKEDVQILTFGKEGSLNDLEKKINQVDLIKIDTEGFEYGVLLGLEDYIKKIKFILFEHHYDNMLIKNYKFTDIHKLLNNNGFQKIFKTKMPFRKSFDYIYENKN